MPTSRDDSQAKIKHNVHYQEQDSSKDNETYTVIDEGCLHNYRTELPNIIFDLGLSPFEFIIYANLKRIAGDHGACWKGRKKIAKEIGVCLNTYRSCMKKLSTIHPVLGIPLITITRQHKQDNGDASNVVVITDLWPKNLVWTRERTALKKVIPGSWGDSPRGHVVTPPRGHVVTPPGSCGDPKEDLLLRRSKKEEERERAAPPPPPTSDFSDQKKERAVDVSVSDQEHAKLVKKYGEDFVILCYAELSEWKKSAPPAQVRKHKNDYYRITSWVVEKVKEKILKDRELDARAAKLSTNNSVAANREWAKEHEVENSQFAAECKPEGFLIFSKASSWQKLIGYIEKGFREQCENELRDRKLWKSK